MALRFNWKNKKTGERLAKIKIAYTINRKELVKGTVLALSDALYPADETEKGYREVAKKLTRAQAEKGLRSLLYTYGEISLESSDDYVALDWELRELVWELADQTVTRLFPELETA